MKELNDIISAYDQAVLENKKTALATVVQVEGSSYRRPGARMLVTEDGNITGAISGGCLEGDALRKAQFAIFQQKNKLEIYDTTDEDDLKFGVQLGCNGIVFILFEPIRNDDVNNPINLLRKIAEERKNAVLVTFFNLNRNSDQKGTCGLVKEGGEIYNDESKHLITECTDVLTKRSTDIRLDENGRSALLQFITPAIQLIIIGAGNDAQPLMEMASLLGWKMIVVDGRATHATPQRFAKADQVFVAKPNDILSQLNIDEQTAVILMTHNYNYDVAALEQLISTDCNYIGTLGPKEKLQKMLDELNEKGMVMDENKLGNIYGPVGLDIGAETSEEIALSVIAEIKAVFEKRRGTSLKERKTEIHKRPLILNHE